MTKFVKVAKASDIAEGERRWFDFEEETIVVFNVGGKFYAIADVCTHDGGPLEEGELDGYEVECRAMALVLTSATAMPFPFPL